jgi:hypothetical protein
MRRRPSSRTRCSSSVFDSVTVLARRLAVLEAGDAVVRVEGRVEMDRGRYFRAASVLELAGVAVAFERLLS